MSKQLLISLLVLAGGIAAGWFLRDSRGAFDGAAVPETPPPEMAVVRKIIDGITIELDSGHRVRYLGVRVPSVTDQVECFGKETIQANESILNKRVRLEEDPVLTQARDGTWVRYVYLIQGEAPPSPMATDEQDIFINQRILEGGFGFPVVSQDMRYGEQMLSAARYASATGKGLWSRCEVSDKEGQPATQVMDECTIKGTVGRDLRKIYRTADCPGYRQTTVVESQGGRWFCAEDIARNEGWEKGSECPD